MEKKKQYSKTKVTKVLLDPKQATLAVCSVAGLYLSGAMFCVNGTVGVGRTCHTSPKGGVGGETEVGNMQLQYAPS
ncbi:MAG: hypothetical protein PHQ52_04660 [Candidatus Omnitrophica bacterium]|nr:hypothetical protein [Candidatus Omnitrophota bacterium]